MYVLGPAVYLGDVEGPSRESLCKPAKERTERMPRDALDRAGPLQVQDALKEAEVDVRVRQTTTRYPALIQAEQRAVIGTGRQNARSTRRDPDGAAERASAADPVDDGGGSGAADPEAGTGSFFPSLLERRRRMDQALFAGMEAYLHGVSTLKVDDLVRALSAAAGIGKSQVSRIAPISTLR